MHKEGFMKPCGGLLAPDAQKALARFELNLPKDILVDPQIFSVRTIDLDTGDSCNYQRLYLNLDRHSFDLWLKSLIPENIEVHNNSQCRQIKRNGDYFEIKYLEDGVVKEAKAKYVIAADGAASMVRRSFYPNKLYNTLTFKLRLKIILMLLKCPFMYNPFLRKLVMKSRISTINVINMDSSL